MVTATKSNGNGIRTNRTIPFPVVPEAKFQPPRIALNAVEGWGKTSAGAYAPKPAILMAKGETGYTTLLGAGLVPTVPCVAINEWEDLLALMDHYGTTENMPFKTLVFDATNGFINLCFEYICNKNYNGDWGEKGFTAFQKGYDVALNEWSLFLNRLDKIKDRGVMIMLLGHIKVEKFDNPMGPNYDRIVLDTHKKLYGITARWCDAVLFGTYITITDQDKQTKKYKGIGGTDRIIYTERRDAFDAKNRYGMPEVLDIPNDPSQIWATIWKNIYKPAVNNAAQTGKENQ